MIAFFYLLSVKSIAGYDKIQIKKCNISYEASLSVDPLFTFIWLSLGPALTVPTSAAALTLGYIINATV